MIASFFVQAGAAFDWLLRSSVQASVLILLVMLLRLMLRRRMRPGWAYVVWLLVLARMLLPWTPESALSLYNWAPSSQEEVLQGIGPGVLADVAGNTALDWPVEWMPPAPTEWDTQTARAAEDVVASQTRASRHVTIREALASVWMAGVVALSVLAIAGSVSFWLEVRHASPVTDASVRSLLDDCAAKMGLSRSPTLVQTRNVRSPSLFGLFRPRLLLPEGMVETFDHERLRHIFLHELAHLKRRDIPVGLVASMLQIVHWFNPLVWLAFHRMRTDREMACDTLALSRLGQMPPRQYAETILCLLERYSATTPAPVMVGIVTGKSQLARRMAMIVRFKKGSRGWTLFGVALLVLAGCVALTDARAGSRQDEKVKLDPGSRIDESGRIVDKIDYPFVDDPRVIGQWETVDFVRNINDFNPKVRRWKGEFLKGMVFLEQGDMLGNGTWTKGLVLNQNSRTASKYHITDIDGATYMFFEWKCGDYIVRHRKPSYYVFKKLPRGSRKFEQSSDPFSRNEAPNATSQAGAVGIARKAAKTGKISFMLTEPEELVALLGEPEERQTKIDGDWNVLVLKYPEVMAVFHKAKGSSAPFALQALRAEEKNVDIGWGRTVVLRNEEDLGKFSNPFIGLAGASLVKLDLRPEGEMLSRLMFDSRTAWPPADKLPKGFDPARLLEDGKNPGLGVRKLHAQGIDGRGVRIAIIDQPLLKGHQEYRGRLGHYEAIDCEGLQPQMHGAPVASIAVGKRCGVAPQASLTYFAVPPWSKEWQDNAPYSALLNRILDENRKAEPGERVRVVSISQGQFPQWPHYDLWTRAVKRAEAEGVLVVLCGRETMPYFLLRRIEGRDPDDPRSYCLTKHGTGNAQLLVLTENRTTASHVGPDVYTYWRESGMSWAAPYLGGLAALAFQVDPDIAPGRIIELWKQTAARTPVGPIVNPIGFIEMVKKSKAGA
ncbi:MAG: hypothetical protein JXQ73_13670 [Phycisphaerae bacterium]|nr:hypothetical protein [Phycisphaerae bacterium]